MINGNVTDYEEMLVEIVLMHCVSDMSEKSLAYFRQMVYNG